MKIKTTTDIRERIAVRAYFAAMNDGYKHRPLVYWLHAEAWERQAGIQKRAAAAKKAAVTRKANASAKTPRKVSAAGYEKLVAREASEFRPATRATAH